MKRLRTNQSGFTLIEVIIVVIILGVLAGLAMPRIVGQIARSRSAEAAMELGVIMRTMDGCGNGSIVAATLAPAAQAAVAACDTFAEIGVTPPVNIGAGGPASFAYGGAGDATIARNTAGQTWTSTAAAGAGTIAVVATLVQPGAAANDTITFTYNMVTGAVTKTSAGIFAGIQWQ